MELDQGGVATDSMKEKSAANEPGFKQECVLIMTTNFDTVWCLPSLPQLEVWNDTGGGLEHSQAADRHFIAARRGCTVYVPANWTCLGLS